MSKLTQEHSPLSIPRTLLIEATPFLRWFSMVLASTSAAGVRFLSSVREGRGLKDPLGRRHWHGNRIPMAAGDLSAVSPRE
jgi:hypothetical protein